MDERQTRTVLLVKALESSPKAATWISGSQQRTASEAALASAPRPASDTRSREWAERFLAQRAQALLDQAAHQHPSLHALHTSASLWAGWAWVVPVLAFASGWLSEQVFSPDRIHLLSPALVVVLAWNWGLMLALIGRQLLRLRHLVSSRAAVAPRPANGWASSRVPPWLHRRQWPKAWGLALWPVSQALHRDWRRVAGPLVSTRWVARLHDGSALFSLGLMASLAWKGLYGEYRVGWASAWLDAAQLHSGLSFLATLVGSTPFSLDTLNQLNGWAQVAPPDVGTTWFWLVAKVLLLTVVLPRWLLARWSAWQAKRLSQHLRLDLTEPYYVALLATFGGHSMRLQVWPYSYTLGHAQQASLHTTAHALHGAASTLALMPNTPYGQQPNTESHAPTASHSPHTKAEAAHPVALFSLAATPEAEAHGQFVQHLQHLRPPSAGELALWVDRAPLRRKLGTQAGTRLAEREALWRAFATQHHAQLRLIDLDE